MNINRIEVFRPECNPSFTIVNGAAYLDEDISDLLPYLNATQAKAQYFPKSPYLKFDWQGHRVVVQGSEVRVYNFPDDRDAYRGVEEVVRLIQDVEAKKEEITPDYAPYNPPKALDLFKLMPKKSSCGKCGFTSCMAFAVALSADETELELCEELVKDENFKKNHDTLKEMLIK